MEPRADASSARLRARSWAGPEGLLVAALVLLTAVFAVDCVLPPGYAMGTLYVGITLIAFWLPWKRAILGLAALDSVFLALGYVLPLSSPLFETPATLANRVFALVVIWWASALALAHRRYRSALEESEAKIRGNEARLRSIFETTPEAFIAIDQAGTVDTFSRSAEQLFGYSADEVIGKNVSMLMPSPYREEHDSYMRRYLRTGEKRIIGIGRVVSGRRKDGSVFPMELAVGETKTNSHRIFTGFLRDLTATQRIEQELRQAQKMEAVGQLTGGIAHDFNNLLTVILGNLEMLESRLADPEQREFVNEARETAEQGAQLTQRLLAFGRRQPLSPVLTDLRKLLADLEPLLTRTLGETIEVRITVAAGVPEILVDPNQLHNALLNLAINARDAMPGGGKLSIRAENVEIEMDYARAHSEVRPGHYVVVAVSDTGTGMPRDVQERAFEPFFTTKEVGAGSGLGLSMVYGFVKQSNGHAQIYSEPGHGTTVRLYLPRAAAAEAPKAEGAEDRLPKARARGETILVVEDEVRVRRLTVKRLQDLGYDVQEAPNGPAALALLEQKANRIDLVFSDIVMPGGMTGVELGREVRARWPEIKVLFTSGYADQDILRHGNTGGAEWLRKPYTAADLAARLRSVLDAG